MIAVLTTHPIQYQAPIWRMLGQRGRAPVKVYYLSRQGLARVHDPGFGRELAWDIDLTSGYRHTFARARESATQESFLWLSLAENLPRRMRAEGARVLWIQGWQVLAYWQAAALARAAGLRLWLRGETNGASAGRGLARTLALSALFSRVDRFFCIGAANRDYYLSRGVPASRLASAPYGVDNARFFGAADALRPARARLRQAFGIPEGEFCVAFVGKLLARKRPFDLVDAARALNAQRGGRRVHLLFVGDGELRGELARQCPESTRLGFLNQSEIVQAYVAADCLALPSEASETWGLVVNEAMASGLPVVVSDACGAAADLVRPFWPALTHRCGDALGLAAALAVARSAPPTIEALRAVVARHDPLHTVEAIERAYAEILQGEPLAWQSARRAPDPGRA